MAVYKENFKIDSMVMIADSKYLEDFRLNWKYHHKLNAEQIDFAGCVARVEKVSFYHGGDVLYELHKVPGIWHEQCLRSVNQKSES